MKKQTAVEWLEIQLKKGIDFNPLEPLGYRKAIDNLFQQAKALEKKQIISANEDCLMNELGELLSGEQYYTSTYG